VSEYEKEQQMKNIQEARERERENKERKREKKRENSEHRRVVVCAAIKLIVERHTSHLSPAERDILAAWISHYIFLSCANNISTP
jgi:hypothetical protein